LCPWLCAAPQAIVPREEPAPNPDLPSLDVTEGYGAAKWGMSVADFEKAFPQAKLQSEVEEDIWSQHAASKTYGMGNEGLKMQFTFLRGKLVNIDLETSIKGMPFRGGSMVERNLKSLEALINQQFAVLKDSGVVVRVWFPYRNFSPPLPAVAPQPVP